MSIQGSLQTTRVDLPNELDSPQSKLVYFALAVEGSATVDGLQAQLGIGKLSLLSILDSLAERDLVDRSGDRYVPQA